MRILAVILAFLAPPAVAQDSGLQELSTGDAVRGWQAVGRLNLGGAGFCTAALIAPDRVLTAAHCLYDPHTHERLAPDQLEFLAGWRNGRAEAIRSVRATAQSADFDMQAGAQAENVVGDVAVLALAQPIRLPSVQPFAMTPNFLMPGQRLAVVSYARGRAEAPSLQSACHVLERRASGLLVMSCDIDHGSSGAPVFAVNGDEIAIVSLVSAQVAGSERPIALGADLGPRIQRLLEELDGGVVQTLPRVRQVPQQEPRQETRQEPRRVPGGAQGARGTARFVRP